MGYLIQRQYSVTHVYLIRRQYTDHNYSLQGVLQLSLPPIMYYVNNFPKHRMVVMWLGMLVCTFSAIGAGFAETVSLRRDNVFSTKLILDSSLYN